MPGTVKHFVAVLAAVASMVQMAAAQSDQRPRLQTNETYIDDLNRPTKLDANDLMAVFGLVFSSLPDRVKVFPTENYYYFGFVHDGIRYAGNIRLDASNRDEGKVDFGYYEDTAQWFDESAVKHDVLDQSKGVTVEKVERFLYRITYQGKSVLFALNDLSAVKPPAGALAPDETFIGPIFDESGIRFFLVYNPKLKLFLYILDETVKVADGFFPARRTDRISIGKRTGFAFYRDHKLDRKILIGVFDGNAQANNYFDGPFDQLPDNFIEGEALRAAILTVQPALKGQIDRFGGSADGSVRYMIAPYLPYRSQDDLFPLHRCATRLKNQAVYYRCFVTDDEGSGLGPVHTRKQSRAAKQ